MLTTWLCAALAAAAISYVVTRAGIFEPVRDAVERRSHKLGELLRCPLCFGHWVIFIMAAFIQEPAFAGNWVFGMVISIFASVCIMAMVHFVLLRAYTPIMTEGLHEKMAALKMRDAAAEVAADMGYPQVAEGIKDSLSVR